MKRDELNDLAAFATVAEEGNFTRAAAKLGMSQSALSHAIKALEQRIGLPLLTRTTRSVSTTEAGERLLQTLRPALDSIATELANISDLGDTPSGTVRITADQVAARWLIQPMLARFMAMYPNITVEINTDDGLTDIVADRFDAGVRLGELIAQDMISVRIGPDVRTAIVATPEYLAKNPAPIVTPQDLKSHRCMNYRLQTAGGMYAWEFSRGGRMIEVRVDGPLIINNWALALASVLDGAGIGYCFEHEVAQHIADGRLVRLLEDWSPTFHGYHLYFPDRRRTPALSAFIDAIRWKGNGNGVHS
ncbi:MAG: LysR family transcriptional regulator [Oxalicibacterium faecigallinarum]|uniref:LysR family transcriptional regulator n=1 Tax=Oxalicibacterium faecigallinarum TaxID=573741 RepID=UPI002807710E|nr:LysR family transcriptional regulator [Oxalicibacterium faecigallinarum]MDQ7968500.1 LysR family transcriptional regulator [Oxalicibacterium faecigallinarum]